jgi:hypothetical protein
VRDLTTALERDKEVLSIDPRTTSEHAAMILTATCESILERPRGGSQRLSMRETGTVALAANVFTRH